jgi:hypothetical protein
MAPPRAAPAGALPARFLVVLLLVDFGLRLAFALRPLPLLDDLFLQDDSYYSLHLARSIGQGHGPSVGLAPTNGFQPLHVFLMAPIFALQPAGPFLPIRLALILASLWDVAALWMLHRLASRAFQTRSAILVTLAAWILSPYVIQTTLNGLETVIAAFFLIACARRLEALRAEPELVRRARWALGSGALFGIAGLARIDALLLAPWAMLAMVAATRSEPPGARARLLLWSVVGAALAYLPWLFYSLRQTGDLLPVSGRAVRLMTLASLEGPPGWSNLYAPMLSKAAGVVLRKNAPVLVLAVLLLSSLALTCGRAGMASLREKLRPVRPLLGFCATLVLAYALFVFGSWHFPRYLFPVSIVLALALGALLDALAAGQASAGHDPSGRGLAPRLAAGACVLALAAGFAAHPTVRRAFAPSPPGPWGYMRIGLWAREHYPPGTVIGGFQTGALGYFADRLVVVNLDGVVNRDAYRALRERRMLDYIRSTGARELVWQDDIDIVRRRSRGTRAADLERISQVPGVTTWGHPWFVYRVGGAR